MRFACFIGQILGLTVFLSACVGTSIIVEGRTGKPVAPEQVQLFYSVLPDCDYEVIALIEIPGNHFSVASLTDGFRKRAARLGANAVQVNYLKKTGTSEYLGQARALRCAPSGQLPDAEAMI